MATIIDGSKRIPFLRGMLTHYLLEHGLSFQQAYEVADNIRRETQKKKTVPADKMVELVREQVQEVMGEHPVGDCVFCAPRSRQILVEDEGKSRRFSRERLSDSVVVSGVDEDEAYRLAQQIEADFVRAERTVVSRKDIRKATIAALRDTFGEAYCERYRTWHLFRTLDPPEPLIVLIGGASGAGKTSIAVAVANLLNISRVASTDQIRQVMRLMIASDLMPALHSSSYLAWKDTGGTLEDVIPAYREQSKRVCVGVRASIERAIEENVGLIVDGVHLLPDLLDFSPYANAAAFVHVNLMISDPASYEERFQKRGKASSRRSQHRYIENLDQIMTIQKHLLEVGEVNGVTPIENTDFDETVQAVVITAMDTLRERIRKS